MIANEKQIHKKNRVHGKKKETKKLKKRRKKLAGERSGQVSQKKRQRGKKEGEHIMTHPGPAELSSLEKKNRELGEKKRNKEKKNPFSLLWVLFFQKKYSYILLLLQQQQTLFLPLSRVDLNPQNLGFCFISLYTGEYLYHLLILDPFFIINCTVSQLHGSFLEFN